MKVELFQDIVIKIGKNQQENWDLIDSSYEKFTWLHLNSYPSGHVVIEDENPSSEVISAAASLCKENTKYRNLKNVKVAYTLIGNLKKGKEIGSVYYQSNRKVKYVTI